MPQPVSTPPSGEGAAEVITPLQKLLAGTLVLSLISVPLFSFAFYLLPFYKAEGAMYRGSYWLIGALVAIAVSAVFSYLWMTAVPGILEKRKTRAAERAAAAREERRLEKKRDAEQRREDRAAVKSAALADAEE